MGPCKALGPRAGIGYEALLGGRTQPFEFRSSGADLTRSKSEWKTAKHEAEGVWSRRQQDCGLCEENQKQRSKARQWAEIGREHHFSNAQPAGRLLNKTPWSIITEAPTSSFFSRGPLFPSFSFPQVTFSTILLGCCYCHLTRQSDHQSSIN